MALCIGQSMAYCGCHTLKRQRGGKNKFSALWELTVELERQKEEKGWGLARPLARGLTERFRFRGQGGRS